MPTAATAPSRSAVRIPTRPRRSPRPRPPCRRSTRCGLPSAVRRSICWCPSSHPHRPLRRMLPRWRPGRRSTPTCSASVCASSARRQEYRHAWRGGRSGSRRTACSGCSTGRPVRPARTGNGGGGRPGSGCARMTVGPLGKTAGVNRVLLRRRGDAAVEAREYADDGTAVGVTRLSAGELAGFVGDRERAPVRWVWDDTTRWYPGLLAAGVRVERCTDLRLAHAILRRSPFVDRSLLACDEATGWAALQPVTAAEPGLFPLDDPAGRLDPAAEHRRQRAVLAASPQRGRLGLLLAAESSGALVAAEMTSAGLPWRADVHDRLLTELLGPRPPAGARPAALERLAQEIRAALRAPDLNPDSPPGLLRALQTAGLPVADTRSWTLEQLDHPVIPPLLEYKKLARLLAANGWNWLDTWVRDGRFRSSFLPGGVVTGRWASSGGGALSVPLQVRPAAVADDGWRFVVADVAQLEPRVLAAMSGDTAMAEAARSADLYQGMVASGAVAAPAGAKGGGLGAV